MLTRTKSAVATVALLAAPLSVGALTVSHADAAGKKYSSCDALHKDYKHGVSKSKRAAKKQVRAGYGKPASGKRAKAVYRANKANLDRDKDGTACEA